jgi:hypothetical protein
MKTKILISAIFIFSTLLFFTIFNPDAESNYITKSDTGDFIYVVWVYNGSTPVAQGKSFSSAGWRRN